MRHRSGAAQAHPACRQAGAGRARRLNKSPIVAVGIDRGGTWIRIVGLDASGREIRSLKKPSPSLEALPSLLKSVLRRWKARPQKIAVASRGVWKPAKRKSVARLLRGLAPTIRVLSDVEAAWLAAFATTGQGILLIAGTGSIAYAHDARGKTGRAGGLGPEKGDEGSGYWIGKTWRSFNGPATPANVRRIAGTARLVWRQAQRGNPRARRVIAEAQRHLATLVVTLADRLHWQGTIPLAFAGSVLEEPRFAAGLSRILPRRFKRVPLRVSPAVAALNEIR